MLPPLSPVSMLATPSMVMLFELVRWPFALRLLTCVGVSAVGMTPGTSPASPKKLRPLTAMFWIAEVCSVKARSPLRSWMSVEAPVTVMLSLIWPIVSVKLPICSRSLALTRTLGRCTVWKPSRLIFSV